MEKLINVKELAEIMGLARSEVYRLARRGELPHIRAGKYIRFNPEEVVAALHQEAMQTRSEVIGSD